MSYQTLIIILTLFIIVLIGIAWWLAKECNRADEKIKVLKEQLSKTEVRYVTEYGYEINKWASLTHLDKETINVLSEDDLAKLENDVRKRCAEQFEKQVMPYVEFTARYNVRECCYDIGAMIRIASSKEKKSLMESIKEAEDIWIS